MSTKTCSKCGWVYPQTYTSIKCKFCGTVIEENIPINKAKKAARDAAWYKKRYKLSDDIFAEWLADISHIPLPYKTLTEEQWQEACRYFGGCAYCGSDDIDARSMFIPFNIGGRYCAWNVIPACERCEGILKVQPNPFKRMDSVLHPGARATTEYNWTVDNLQKISNYLSDKIKEAMNEQKRET